MQAKFPNQIRRSHDPINRQDLYEDALEPISWSEGDVKSVLLLFTPGAAAGPFDSP
jgi:hypothetical protein